MSTLTGPPPPYLAPPLPPPHSDTQVSSGGLVSALKGVRPYPLPLVSSYFPPPHTHTTQVSSGGLVSALKGVSSYQTIWVGWPGENEGGGNGFWEYGGF